MQRRDFKDASIVKSQSGNLLFSLLDIWKPVQQEVRLSRSFLCFLCLLVRLLIFRFRIPRRSQVRALLHDYLTDDQTGTVSSRNPIVSVNEVLRLAKPRDSTKVRPRSIRIIPRPNSQLKSHFFFFFSSRHSKSSNSPIAILKPLPKP